MFLRSAIVYSNLVFLLKITIIQSANLIRLSYLNNLSFFVLQITNYYLTIIIINNDDVSLGQTKTQILYKAQLQLLITLRNIK